MTPIAHGTFAIERVYPVAPARVFAAWSDIEVKQRWFIGPEEWTPIRRELTLEAGAQEILHGRFPSGFETLYTARFHAVSRDERIVAVYDMHLNGIHHSVSLSTVEFIPEGDGTRLIYTEQTAWLDGTNGADGTAARERGVGWHLDNLGRLFSDN